MKKHHLIIYLFAGLLLCACEQEEIGMPTVSFNMSQESATVNETVEFEYTGTEAKQVVVYTGDAGHDYSLKTKSNTGLVMNKGRLTYAYKVPGTYTVVVVATNYDKMGNEIIFASAEKQIVVEDDRTDLRQVSLKKDLYNKELLPTAIDNTLFFAVPHKVRLRGKDIPINLSAQRLEATAYSQNASILIDDEPYVANTKYDLTKPATLKVISAAGAAQAYDIRTLWLPEFSSFTINGVKGIAAYSDFDFDKMSISVVLPAGTDLTALLPEFVSTDAKSVMINGVEQTSGASTVDFTNTVVYTLHNNNGEELPALACKMEVSVTVTTEQQ